MLEFTDIESANLEIAALRNFIALQDVRFRKMEKIATDAIAMSQRLIAMNENTIGDLTAFRTSMTDSMEKVFGRESPLHPDNVENLLKSRGGWCTNWLA